MGFSNRAVFLHCWLFLDCYLFDWGKVHHSRKNVFGIHSMFAGALLKLRYAWAQYETFNLSFLSTDISLLHNSNLSFLCIQALIGKSADPFRKLSPLTSTFESSFWLSLSFGRSSLSFTHEHFLKTAPGDPRWCSSRLGSGKRRKSTSLSSPAYFRNLQYIIISEPITEPWNDLCILGIFSGYHTLVLPMFQHMLISSSLDDSMLELEIIDNSGYGYCLYQMCCCRSLELTRIRSKSISSDYKH